MLLPYRQILTAARCLIYIYGRLTNTANQKPCYLERFPSASSALKKSRVAQKCHPTDLTYKKRARRGSNPRPSGPEPDALSTELRALNLCDYITYLRNLTANLTTEKSEIIHRIYRFAIFTHFKMKVRASR